MSKPPWCRLYSEVLSDRKIEYICRKTQQPKVVILGAWTTFLALANDSPVRGVLLLTEGISYTEADLAGEMGIDTDQACGIIGAFVELGLLTIEDDDIYHVTNFNKRNYASDNSAERVRAWRAKQDEEGKEKTPNDYGKGNGDEALQGSYSNGDVTPSEAEAKAEPETKTETEKAAKPPPPPPRGKRKTPKPKTPVPPAVRVFRANAHRFPAKSWYEDVVQTVGEVQADLDRWGLVVKAWVGCGYNPTNVKGMLECYREGTIPSTSSKGKPAEPSGYPAIRAYAARRGAGGDAQ